jgi:hypothetical protein
LQAIDANHEDDVKHRPPPWPWDPTNFRFILHSKYSGALMMHLTLSTKYQNSEQSDHNRLFLDDQDHRIWWFDLDHMILPRLNPMAEFTGPLVKATIRSNLI